MKFLLFSLWAALCGRQTVTACNIAEASSPTGRKTFVTEAPVTARYLFAKAGTVAGTIALCDDTAKPLGLITDTTEVAGEHIAVDLLGATLGTRLVIAGAAVTRDQQLVSDANAKAVPAATGKWCVGRALNDAAAGELVEFVPCFPHLV